MKDYYVYIYYRLDTNEPFYVGMGHGYRWRELRNRNQHFKNIVNKYLFVVEIVKENLTQFEAFYWEEKIIEILVFEYGFSIDIKNNRSSEKGYHLVNMTWGGEGTSGTEPWNKGKKMSEEFRNKISEQTKGENNPNYGKHWTEEWKKRHSEKMKGKMIGELNPFYGKRHSEESREKMSRNHANFKGGNSTLAKRIVCLNTLEIFNSISEASEKYGNRTGITSCCKGIYNSSGTLEDFTPLVWRYYDDYLKMTKEEINLAIQKALNNNKGERNGFTKARYIGKDNKKSKSVICLTTKRIFYSMGEAGRYYNLKSYTDICSVCKGRRKYCGQLPDGTKLVWRYIKWNHNKKFRIK